MAYPISQEALNLFTTQHKQIAEIAFRGVAETKTITEEDIIQGGLSIDRYCVSGSRIEIGSAVAAELSLTLDNKDGRFNNTTFEGAELYVSIGTKKWEARRWENAQKHFVPMGYFTVDNSPRKLSCITLSALDRMVHFDKSVNPDNLSFPMTIGELLEQICDICNVELATDVLTLINNDYVINEYPQDDDLIYRQLLMWIAEITGTCAYIDWEGKLRLEWYKTEYSAKIDTSMRFSSDLLENALTISGVRIKVSDEDNVLCGSEDYALLIEGNGLIQHDSETLAQSIYNKVGGFSYTPYDSVTKPFVNLYPLDSIVFVDKDGVEIPSVVTNTTFLINGNMAISAQGETATNDGYAKANPLTQQERYIIDEAKRQANKQLNRNVQSILSFNELISNALGIYASVVEDGSGGKKYYMHDKPILEESSTIYTMNAGGYAYTNSGWNNGNPAWQYGFDKNGNAVYKEVCAYGMQVSNPNGSYSATISPDAFKIWQNAVILLDASKEGLKIFNSGITIFKGSGSNAKKVMYFDTSGNIAMDGYLTQYGSNYKLLVGNDYRNEGGLLFFDESPTLKKADGTYKPLFSFWHSVEDNAVLEAAKQMSIAVTGLEETTNYTRIHLTTTGGKFYGGWDFGEEQHFSVNLGANCFKLWNGNTQIGSIYHSTGGNMCLFSNNGKNVLIGNVNSSIEAGNKEGTLIGAWGIVDKNGYYRLSTDTNGGKLWGSWDFGEEQKFTHTINVPAFIVRKGGTGAKVMSMYISTGDNPCFNSDNGKDFYFVVGGTTRLGATTYGGFVDGKFQVNTESNYVSLVTDQTGNGGGKLWGSWYLGNDTAINSDENKKNSIEPLDERYSILFDNIEPVRYKYNEGTSDRYHTGFISNRIEEALEKAGLDTKEFAGFVKTEDGDYYLRYSEFTALAVNEIQTLKKKNSDLEQRVADLESKLETILNKLGG